MKGLVIYDSVYGNTKKVAEAIAEQIKLDGYDAEMVNLKESASPKIERGPDVPWLSDQVFWTNFQG